MLQSMGSQRVKHDFVTEPTTYLKVAKGLVLESSHHKKTIFIMNLVINVD